LTFDKGIVQSADAVSNSFLDTRIPAMRTMYSDDRRSPQQVIADQKSGWALERRLYTDPDIYALELDQIVMRSWILIGHVSQYPDAGDFRVVNVADESAIIVRGDDGKLRAFANVCRHRGSLVCLEHKGNARKFECPYHGWMYSNDGRLVAARSMPQGFDRSGFSLRSLSLDTVHGLVFLSFSDDPPALEAAKREMAEPMAMFDFEHLKVAAQKSYAIPANWKLSVENYQECYHCATAHPEYARMHTLMLDPRQRERLQAQMQDRMGACGLRNLAIDRLDQKALPGQEGYFYNRTAMFEGYLTGSRDGQPVAPLLGNLTAYDGGASDLGFGPLSYLLAYSDHVVGYVFTPVDVNNSRCEIYWLVRGDAEEGRDYRRDELTWLWDVTTESDKTIIVNNSKGVRSRHYRPGPLSDMEAPQVRYLNWILDQLRHGRDDPGRAA
jgi:phenylpropionate dioxygenase-like ring-hydroxylating dioxygenase large terminal subunit